MISKAWRLSFIPALVLMLSPALALGQVDISVNIAPPELPVYDQPPIPGDGYIWTPGYWAWDDGIQDYYWVPGTWVEAPETGYLWTPGYWAAEGAAFFWHPGYWGPQVGFYGGVDYGHGYGGRGYEGGYWRGGHLFYNRAVVNVGSAHIDHVYDRAVHNTHSTRVSFNGGHGGVRAQASAAEMAAARGRHVEATRSQVQQRDTARGNPELRVRSNHGHPPIAATPRAGNFSNPVPARNAVNPQHATPRPRVNTPAESRPAEHAAPMHRPAPQPRTNTPRERPVNPQERPAPQQHTAPQERPQERPTQERPTPQQRPAPQERPQERPTQERPTPQQRPAPQERPQERPTQERPTPQQRPAPQRQEHTQPTKPPPRPEAKPHPSEHPEDHEHH